MVETTENNVRYVVGTGNLFAFPYRIFNATDIEVYLEAEDGGSVHLVSGVDYTATPKPDLSDGADVTLNTGTTNVPVLPTGRRLTILRIVPYKQLVNLPEYGKLPSSALETQLDKIEAGLQQLAEADTRAVKMPITSAEDPEEFVPKVLSAAENARIAETAATDAAGSAQAASGSAAEALASEGHAGSAATEAADFALAAAASASDAAGSAAAAAASASSVSGAAELKRQFTFYHGKGVVNFGDWDLGSADDTSYFPITWDFGPWGDPDDGLVIDCLTA